MVIEESIVIHAPLDKVWKTFTDLTCWEEWNTVMENICTGEKCLSHGAEISCSFRPFLFPVKAAIKIEEVTPYKCIVWSTQKKGFFARNIFTFQSNKKGVMVTSRENFNGLVVKVFGFLFPEKKMRTLIQTFLKNIKTASENLTDK